MIPTLMSYTTLKALSTAPSPGSLQPLVVVVKLAESISSSDPLLLVKKCVAITLVPHPGLDSLLRKHNFERSGNTYTIAASKEQRDVLKQVVQSSVTITTSSATKTKKAQLSQTVKFHTTGTTLTVTPEARSAVASGHPLGVGDTHKLMLTPSQAVHAIKDCLSQGWLVVSATEPAAVSSLFEKVSNSYIALPVTDAPGWADVYINGESTPQATLPAMEAVNLAAEANPETTVAVATKVTVASNIAVATLTPAPKKSTMLKEWQARFVSAYLNSPLGLVNALPPGAGKTVCAAAALSAKATMHKSKVSAFVIAPSALHEQWEQELTKFFPQAEVEKCNTADSLTNLNTLSSSSSKIVISSMRAVSNFVSSGGQLPANTFSDLVVDEAAFLRNSTSAQSLTLWSLRPVFPSAMLLTGTPETHSVQDTGALLSFVLNDASLFSTFPLAQQHPRCPGDRTAPFVFSVESRVLKGMPSAPPNVVILPPTALELEIETTAVKTAHHLLERSASAIKMNSLLTAWRLGLASPAALMSSKYSLAVDVAKHYEDSHSTALVSSKISWTVKQAIKEVEEGRSVLLFSDSLHILNDLRHQLYGLDFSVDTISSETSIKARAQGIADFNKGKTSVLLIGTAGQLGLNLQKASTVIHVDLPSTQSAFKQRTARAVRLGSVHEDVRVFIPLLEKCADQKMYLDLASPKTAAETLTQLIK